MNQANVVAAQTTVPLQNLDAGLEVTVYDTGNILLQVPVTRPGINTRHTLPGTDRHSFDITSLDAAFAHTNRVEFRKPPPPGDDFVTVRVNSNNYRKQKYSAMIILPQDVNNLQENAWGRLKAALEYGRFSFKDIEAKAWILTEEIIKLHERGLTSAAKHDKCLDSVQDRGLTTCSVRMNVVIYYLHYNKSICYDLMESQLALLRFVAAPHAVMKERPGVKVGYEQTIKELETGARLNGAHIPPPPPVSTSSSGAPPPATPTALPQAHPVLATSNSALPEVTSGGVTDPFTSTATNGSEEPSCKLTKVKDERV